MNSLEDDIEFVLFDDPSVDNLIYGKSVEYNSSRIYGSFYHSEIYRRTPFDPFLRVFTLFPFDMFRSTIFAVQNIPWNTLFIFRLFLLIS